MQILRAAGHFAVPDGEPNQYREHLRTPDLSVGTYCIPVGGKDGQEPHTEDEIYVVLRGRATLVSEGTESSAGGTSIRTESSAGGTSIGTESSAGGTSIGTESSAGGTSIRTEYEVGPGCVVHVAAGERHHFTDVTEDLSVVVVFAPAERTRGADRAEEAYYSDTVIWAAE